MKVTIMIAAYNHEQYIAQCLDSCLSQTYQNIEVIAVDDCSTDKTYEIIEAFGKRYSRIIPYRNERNLGEYGTRNEAIRKSSGSHIAYLDSDDVLTPTSIGVRARAFAENPLADVVCGKVIRFGDATGEYPYHLPGPGVMIARRVFKRYGLFYPRCYYRGDREFWIRTGIQPYGELVKNRLPAVLVNIPEVCAFYRVTQGSNADKMKTDTIERAAFRDRLKVLETDGITKTNTEWLEGA